MQSVDYIIVGAGLGGLVFAQKLLEENRSFFLFDDGFQGATSVSIGVYNSIILKRFTPVWQGSNQLLILREVYGYFEGKFKKKYLREINTYRLFSSIAEQNLWMEKAECPDLSSFLDSQLISKKYQGIRSPLGFGGVCHTGRLDIIKIRKDIIRFLMDTGRYKGTV